MRSNIVLVDFENVQPDDIALLQDGPFKVKIFLGQNQSKVPVSLAAALQPLGTNAEYVMLDSSGKNALDFHIAYYLGQLATADSSAYFHVISKDTGFDPLISHLKGQRISAARSPSISEIPYFKAKTTSVPNNQIETAIADLTRRKDSKPRTEKTLLSTLHALFKKELSESQLSNLLQALCARGIVTLEGAKVSYRLPTSPP